MVRVGRIIVVLAAICERLARAIVNTPLLCALHRLWQSARDKNRGATLGVIRGAVLK